MNPFVPAQVFLTRGRGQHREKLVSFEIALREAGIAPFNLVRVSSIFPPGCKLVSRDAGLKRLSPGQIVFLILSENATDEPHRLISASIGMAIPGDPACYGYLAEHDGHGETEREAGIYTEALAAEMLATKLGAPLKSVRTKSVSQTAEGAKGLWTTAVAAAVLIP
jgi:arginine decarboxylase